MPSYATRKPKRRLPPACPGHDRRSWTIADRRCGARSRARPSSFTARRRSTMPTGGYQRTFNASMSRERAPCSTPARRRTGTCAAARCAFQHRRRVWRRHAARRRLARRRPASTRDRLCHSRKSRQRTLVSAEWGRMRRCDPVVNLRLATVYGPRDRGNMARMIDAIVRGQYLTIGNGTESQDLRRRTQRGRERRGWHRSRTPTRLSSSGRPFVVADPHPYTLREIERSVRLAAGIMRTGRVTSFPYSPRSLPLLCARSGSRFWNALRSRGENRRSRARRYAVSRRTMSTTCEYFCRRFPVTQPPVATLDEGMAEAVAWYRQAGTAEASS